VLTHTMHLHIAI